MVAAVGALFATFALSACTTDGSLVGSSSSSSSSSLSSTTPTPTPTKDPFSASVVVAGVDLDGQHVSVSGYVDGVAEDGGTCTFTMKPSAGGTAVTVTSEGRANVTNTTCGTQQSPIANFSKGSWSVVLEYRSSAASATSEPIEMEIP